MAGKGKRFTDKNIKIPKYLLRLDDNKTILEKSLKSFNFSKKVKFYFVINKVHEAFGSQIGDIFSGYSNSYEVIITEDTEGQAETGFIGCKSIDNNNPVFFFNGDTILKNRDIEKMANDLYQTFSGGIDVFLEDRNHFSFVKLSDELLVEKIAEKVVISNYATTGLYGFSNKKIYIKYYNLINISSEKYISDIYKLMIFENEKIKGYVSTNDLDTIILGTPEEYFLNKNKV